MNPDPITMSKDIDVLSARPYRLPGSDSIQFNLVIHLFLTVPLPKR